MLSGDYCWVHHKMCKQLDCCVLPRQSSLIKALSAIYLALVRQHSSVLLPTASCVAGMVLQYSTATRLLCVQDSSGQLAIGGHTL